MYNAEKFWSKLYKVSENGCWLWTGSKTVQGYGCAQTRFLGYYVEGAHRIAFCIVNGPVPEGLFVLHKCNNPPCCNPDRLYAGTKLDNKRDQMLAGTFKLPDNRGERHGMSKLNIDQVREIIKLDVPRKEYARVAEQYGVAVTTIYDIKGRRSWSHVQF